MSVCSLPCSSLPTRLRWKLFCFEDSRFLREMVQFGACSSFYPIRFLMFFSLFFSSMIHSVVSQECDAQSNLQTRFIPSEEEHIIAAFSLIKTVFSYNLKSEHDGLHIFIIILCHLFLAWKQKCIVISSHMDNLSQPQYIKLQRTRQAEETREERKMYNSEKMHIFYFCS